jgi:hypothetical protein
VAIAKKALAKASEYPHMGTSPAQQGPASWSEAKPVSKQNLSQSKNCFEAKPVLVSDAL